jgi:Bacterial Ig-like domain (group 2)
MSQKTVAAFTIGTMLLLGVLTLFNCGGDRSDGDSKRLTSIKVSSGNSAILIGTTQQFIATGTFSDGTTQNVTAGATWSSSDATKATISNVSGSQGLATGSNIGSTTITATSGGISGRAAVTVTNASLGSNWTLKSYHFGKVAWSGTQFVAVGDGGTILTSPDGVAWTVQASGISDALRSVAWSGTQYLAVGDEGLVLGSP